MVKRLLKHILLLGIPLLFAFCGKQEYQNDYILASDGLIYYKDSGKLFSGIVSDTSGFIVHYEVENGKKNGKFIILFPNGKIAQDGNLVDNKNEGKWKYYYINGKLESEGWFRNDRPEGKWTFYYLNGNLKQTGNYLKGIRQGEWKSYRLDGKLDNIYYYQNGLVVDKVFKKS